MSRLYTILQTNYHPKGKYKRKTFNKDKLPKPRFVYSRFGIALTHGNWHLVKCPFHDDTHASMGVNGTHGGYCCHACGAKGSMINFYMAMTGKTYKQAMIELGGYDDK